MSATGRRNSISIAWNRRVEVYKGIADSCGNGKYNFIHHALKGDINMQRLDEVCQKVRQRGKDVDMDIVDLIRILFLLPIDDLKNPTNKYVVNKITSALDDFPFWPSNKDAHLAGAEALCFWSENHILMLLSSAHLYRQWRRKMTISENGVYTATNVVTGGIIREDHNVINVTSLGSALYAVSEQDERLQKNLDNNNQGAKEEGRGTDELNESRKVIKQGTSSPQKDKVIAARDSLAAYYKICSRYWTNVNSSTGGDVKNQAVGDSSKKVVKFDDDVDEESEDDLKEEEALANDLSGAALEEALLHSYINSHVEFGGMFELNSHVYIPYTMSALLNLIDFSEDVELVRLANILIEATLKPMLLCTTNKNVCSLAAGARAFPRTRCRVHGHNANQVLNFLVGSSPDNLWVSPITDFLATTSWRPSADLLSYHTFSGRVQYRGSPTLADLKTMFPGIPELEKVPFLWSAGLLVHPDFVSLTKRYIALKKMQNNETLWPLKLISTGLAPSLASWLDRLSRGQLYSDVVFNVYKRDDGLCMSSFETFNVGKAGFQQLPWIVNLDGIGVWSESGSIGDIFAGFLMTNTYSPNVVQRGGVLVCSYAAPSSLKSIFGISSKAWAHIVWPSQLFDKQRIYEEAPSKQSSDKSAETNAKKEWLSCSVTTRPAKRCSWRVASRNQCYIGVGSFQESFILPSSVDDDTTSPPTTDKKKPNNKEGVQIFYEGDNFTVASRIVSKDKYNTFVVVVANHEEFHSDFDAFANRCLSITCSKGLDSGKKHLTVQIIDPNEGVIDVKTDLE